MFFQILIVELYMILQLTLMEDYFWYIYMYKPRKQSVGVI